MYTHTHANGIRTNMVHYFAMVNKTYLPSCKSLPVKRMNNRNYNQSIKLSRKNSKVLQQQQKKILNSLHSSFIIQYDLTKKKSFYIFLLSFRAPHHHRNNQFDEAEKERKKDSILMP